jgi:hypothetical protein
MQWYGAIMALLGKFFIARKNRAGMVCEIVANIFFLIMGINLHLWGIMFLSAVSIGIYSWGYCHWGKK